MLRKVFAGIVGLAVSVSVQAAPVLYDWGFDVDGTFVLAADVYSAPDAFDLADLASLGVDVSGYDFATAFDDPSGTGTVTMTVTGAGAHRVGMYIDLEIDEATTTFFNEDVTEAGTPATGQSYEADEPGFFPPGNPIGDIFDNFLDQALENDVYDDGGFGDDFAMALAWDFTLGAGETADITFLVDAVGSLGGIVLTHSDLDTGESYQFSSALTITGGPLPVPEPGSLALLLAGLAGFALRRRAA